MIKPIVTDKKLLSEKCEEVRSLSERFKTITNLKDTAATLERFAGLAAPQIGHMNRIILVLVQGKMTIMVNPEIILTKGKFSLGNESCFSVPSTLVHPVRIKRWFKVKIKYQSELGDTTVKLFKSFEARLIQHEIDHLDGKLIQQRSYYE